VEIPNNNISPETLLKLFASSSSFAQTNSCLWLPADIRQRVRAAYAELGLGEAQPVLMVPLHIYRINQMLQIDKFVTGIGAAATAPVEVML
jgi:hypothetical protein